MKTELSGGTVRCSYKVSGAGQWGYFNKHQCSRKAAVNRPDGAFCKQHDPDVKQAKRNARAAKWDAEYKQLGVAKKDATVGLWMRENKPEQYNEIDEKLRETETQGNN